jgi:hypothetical protein
MKKSSILISLTVFLLLSGLVFTPLIKVALAASLLNKSDAMSSLKVNTASNHTIIFRTPTGVDSPSDTITIEFDKPGTAFTIPGSLDYTDIDLDVSAGGQTSCTGVSFGTSKTLAATAAANTWGVSVNNTTDIITFTAPTNATTGEIPANACVRIKIGTNATTGGTGDQQITNPSSSGEYLIGIAGAFGDSGDIAVNIITDDQVQVSASVTESITFSISDNTIGFGTLSASAARWATGDTNGSAVETPAHNFIVGTNAANGYVVTLDGTTLTFGSNTINPIGGTPTASSPGTEQFGIRITASGGSGSVSSPYNTSNYALDTAAFPDEVASASGASSNTTYNVYYLANISAQTEAGSYTATLTYTATATF